jgi:hypothetical protein
MQLVVIEDQTTSGVLSPSELKTLITTAQLYSKDINNSPWVEHGYVKNPVEVKLLNRGEKFPKGAYNLILLDNISLEGALGYHEDEDEGKIPVSYVPIKEIREEDSSITEVLTHELGEMVVNPFVSKESVMRTVEHERKEYIVEIADPLQECPYEIGIINKQRVANFVYPKWFGLPQIREELCQNNKYYFDTVPPSYVKYINNPFEIFKTGYISVKEPGQEWHQVLGEKIDKLPKWASRLPRIHGTK